MNKFNSFQSLKFVICCSKPAHRRHTKSKGIFFPLHATKEHGEDEESLHLFLTQANHGGV